MIKGIIFDLDGVLCSTDIFHYKAWKVIADELNILFNQKINNRLRGVERRASLEIILSYSDKKYSEEKIQYLLEKKNNIYKSYLKTLTPKDISSGTLEILAFLKSKKIKIAVGSASKNAKFIINQLQISNYFDEIIDGYDITLAKPNPEIFLTAANRINEKPEDCLVIEDAQSGIEAANNGGFTSVSIGNAVKKGSADYHINNLTEISELI